MMRSALAFAVVLLGSAEALACSYVPDERPWATRIGEEPVVFVGTVTAYADASGRELGDPPGKCGDDPLVPCGAAPAVLAVDQVVFEVETALRGVDDDVVMVDQGQGADCGIPFEIGQRWLFAGTFIGGPSVQLDGKSRREVRDLVREAERAVR